ncbi:MAG: hypothetical protein KJ620_02295 [Candidatus Edwardsbacteria bacterium]|nr:hypothetical protein [Candidatus Edwardsbacteria bacterium]MBU1576626.1 hypothetical protein [Candidatus Edwardsbacteria bacterium]MBU2594969.1 hypothetical protein [Candidatus Edwardsbacteria bacterium]
MDKEIKYIYLAHPFTDNYEYNIKRVTAIANAIVKHSIDNPDCFFAPIVPHLILSVFNEEKDNSVRSYTEEISKNLVLFCDELWLVSDIISKGMQLEIQSAQENTIPIRKWSEIKLIVPILCQFDNI